MLFQVWVMFLRPTVKTRLLLWHYCHDPKVHHLLWCSLKSFHQHLNGQQALYWYQHDHVSNLHSPGAAQIWLQHNACQNFEWESHDMWILKFHLSLLLHGPSNDNGTNHILNILDVSYILWCWRSSWMFIVLKWNSSLFQTFVPLMGLCSTHGFVHKHSF